MGCCGSSTEYNDLDDAQPTAVRSVIPLHGPNHPVNRSRPQEQRRQLQLEAAEKRAQTNATRGIQDPDKVRRMQERSQRLEQLEEEAARKGIGGEPVLKVRSQFHSHQPIDRLSLFRSRFRSSGKPLKRNIPCPIAGPLNCYMLLL